MWEEFNRVGNSRRFGDGIIAGVVPVVFWRWAYIIPQGPAVRPGEALSGPIMNGDLTTRGSEGRGVEVEVTMDECMCG